VDLTLAQLRSKLAEGLRGGSFYFHGSDSFLKAEGVPLVVDAHLEPGLREFNLDVFHADTLAVESLASALATPPVGGGYRVVVVREVQALAPAVRQVLEDALPRLPPDVALVATAEEPRGSRARLYVALRESGVAVRCEPPPESALPGWCVERARVAHGVELEPDAAELLVAAFGGLLGVLAEELQKLADYVAPRTTITAEDVRAAAGGALPRVTVWDWLDLVLDRRWGEAIGALRSLLDTGESGVRLVALLGESFVRVGLAASDGRWLERALKRDGAWGYLAWKVPRYRAWGAAWDVAACERALEECLRADRLLKSGGPAPDAILEEMLFRLASFAPAPGGPGSARDRPAAAPGARAQAGRRGRGGGRR
jgi:DNA polymerase III delta subunit